MNSTMTKAILVNRLSYRSWKAVLGQALFIVTAILMPVLTHRFGLDYRAAQPMHWMVFFAGLTYGPVSGILVGALVPVLSHLLSGMPVPAMLPLMIPELVCYGFCGWPGER